MDFTALINKELEKQEERNNSFSGSGFKTLYPFGTGRLEMRLIADEKSGLLYRELHTHVYYVDGKKQKVACLKKMYNESCPICDMVDKVQKDLDDKQVYGKYGVKTQGIAFAKLCGFAPPNYFTDNQNPPKIGEVVIFMFPKSVISALGEMIIDYQNTIEEIITANTGKTVILKIGKQANDFPSFAFLIQDGIATICENSNGEPDEKLYTTFKEELPSLNDMKLPAVPDEKVYTVINTIVEEMNRKYFGEIDKVIKPKLNTIANNTPKLDNVNVDEALDESESTEVTTNEAEKPDCWGDNKYDEACANCPFDSTCP